MEASPGAQTQKAGGEERAGAKGVQIILKPGVGVEEIQKSESSGTRK